MLADKGTYKPGSEIKITCGGEAGAPVTIRGVSSSGQPMAATFAGNRPLDWKPGLSDGRELFRLLSGANHLVFEDLAVKNFGDGAFRIGASISDLTIRDVQANNVKRFINNLTSGASSASVNGLKVQNVKVTDYSENAIRLQYNSQNIVIENTIGNSGQVGERYIAGVMLDGTVHNVRLSRVEMRNNIARGSSSTYWNGDGFLTERGVYNVRFEDTIASGNTDAGYDLKSSNTVLVRTISEGNNRNYRFWYSGTMIDGISRNPQHYGGTGSVAHVWMGDANVTLDGFRFSDSGTAKTLFKLDESGATLRLIDTYVSSEYKNLIDVTGTSKVLRDSTSTSIAADTDGDTGGDATSTAGNDTLRGTAGADLLNGGSGNDRMIGGEGNDTYVVDSSGDVVVELAGEGSDTVQSSRSHTLASNVENLILTGSGAINGSGNSLGNKITGNSAINVVKGGGGSDVLDGAAGNDTLYGGEGADTYRFGRGDGRDIVYNGDSSGADKLLFDSGIATDDLWFAKSGSDLRVTVRGGTESVLVKGWYSDSSNRLSRFEVSDGSALAASNVQKLVTAMASFTTSSGTAATMTTAQQQSVETTVAANWQSA